MMRRTAGLAWGWLPSSVVVPSVPLSAVTGWSVQSIGDVVLGAIVITMTVWAWVGKGRPRAVALFRLGRREEF